MSNDLLDKNGVWQGTLKQYYEFAKDIIEDALDDEDEFLIKDANDKFLAWFYLIYNNGSDYDPMVVISDYSANDYAEGIWNTLNENFGEWLWNPM